MIKVICTQFIVMISFIIFSGASTNQILENITGLFGIGNIPSLSLESVYYFKSYSLILLLGIISATPIFKNILKEFKYKKIINLIEPIFILCVLLLSTSYIIDGSFNPFLYFRF